MAKFLFTMLPANDLGLPTRLVPIARALADRGNEEFVRAATAVQVDLVCDFNPDVVVDSLGLVLASPRAFSRCLLNDPGYPRSARRIAESMRKFGGAQGAADRIERFAGSKA